MRRLQTGANAKTLIFGQPRNIMQSRANLMNDEEDVAFMPGDLRADRATSTAQIDQLKLEFDTLRAIYLQNMNITDTLYQPERPVAADRFALMGPMLRFVEEERSKLEYIMKTYYNLTVIFERLFTASITDRTAEFALLLQYSQLGLLNEQDLRIRALRLV
jgi:hypothetical protein